MIRILRPRPRWPAGSPAFVVLVLATAVVVALAGGSPAGAAAGDGSPSDPNIGYVGRWAADSDGYVPNWAGAYLHTGFTGTTVKLKQRNAIDLYYSIDGAADVYRTNVSGTVNLTPAPLRVGNHTLTVSYRVVAGSYHGDAIFRGLVLDAGARTLPPVQANRLIEFVGDSITVGQTSSKVALTSYGWLTGEQLGADHTQIAQGGACLRELTAAQSTRGVSCVGLQSRFTRTGAQNGSGEWDFSRYTADVVVINLGTNDTSHGVGATDFQSGYTALLRTVRGKYPRAAILALRTFIGRYAAQTQASVNALTAGGDRNVFYVDTTGWLNSSLLTDSVHPNDAGHRAITARLAPIVFAHLGPTTTTTTSASTTTTSRTSTTSHTTTTSSDSVITTTTTTSSNGTTSTGTTGCVALFRVDSTWDGGYVASVTVTAGSVPLNGWTVGLTLAGDSAIGNVWNAQSSGATGQVTFVNAPYNSAVPAGQSVGFGFQASGPAPTTGAGCAAA